MTQGDSGNLLNYQTAIALGIIAPINHPNVNSISCQSDQNVWINKYPFTDKIGTIKNQKVKLHIDRNIIPKKEKLRHIQFHLRQQIEFEISKLIEDDIIEPVNGLTTWISQIVHVLKRNGNNEIRICTDARNENKAILRQRHKKSKILG